MKKGFTLIEMMVAVSLFAIVMMVGVGALLALAEANQRAQAINSVMENLNAAIEGMSRSIRVGTEYHCETSTAVPPPSTLATPSLDAVCGAGGGKLLAFESATGNPSNVNDQVVYRIYGTQLERSKDSGATWVALTAPEVSIDAFEFFLIGAIPGIADATQPRVLMKIKGSAPIPGGRTTFTVQASVTQRLIDI